MEKTIDKLIKKEPSWNAMYKIAKKHKKEFGNFKVGIYEIYEGVYLGVWLLRQIDNFDVLSESRRSRLEKIGFDWTEESVLPYSLSKFESSWMSKYNLLEDYKKENKNVLLSSLEVYKGENLGAWLYRQRVANLNGTLSPERRDLLLDLGVFLGSWDEDGWDYKYAYAKQYYEENGNLVVPIGYMVGGFNLYSWVHFQKQKQLKNELSEERVKLLEDIGMKWSKTYSEKWLSNFKIAEKFFMEHGNLETPRNLVYEGINLDAWLNNQRRAKRGEKHRNITEEQIKKLDGIHMRW